MHPKEDFIKLSQEQNDKLRNKTRTEEGMKQKKLHFNLDRNKRERPQKCKAKNKSGGRDWKSKLLKVIKIDQGLKSIMMSTISTLIKPLFQQ